MEPTITAPGQAEGTRIDDETRTYRPIRPAQTPLPRKSRRGQALVEFAVLIPILMVLFVAVTDLARVYTSMVTIEAAAREAADYGAFNAFIWSNPTAARQDMTHRACLASSSLPGYVGTKDDNAATCTNPQVTINDPTPGPSDPSPGTTDCANSENAYPCWVTVTLEYDFDMILPLHLEFFNVEFGFPSPLTIQRSSTFAMTDLQLDPDPTPTPTPIPTPGPTPTPEPTPTPGPTPTPEPTPTPGPTPTPTPTPEPTPDPTPTPTPEPTPDPTPTPTPTPTPEP